MSNFLQNGEWFLENLLLEKHVKTYTCCDSPYPDITYYVVIRRRSLFYIFNMILPCALITFIAFLGFLVPCESSEKVSISVTTLLSMVVFLMILVENMPPNSDNLPMLGKWSTKTKEENYLSASIPCGSRRFSLTTPEVTSKKVHFIINIIVITSGICICEDYYTTAGRSKRVTTVLHQKPNSYFN